MPKKPPGLRPPRRTPGQRWDHRKTPEQRGYGREHRAIRAELLRDEPLCRECGKTGRVTAAVIADHIIPLSKGGKTVRGNYQPLCRPCHSLKTAREGNEAQRW